MHLLVWGSRSWNLIWFKFIEFPKTMKVAYRVFENVQKSCEQINSLKETDSPLIKKKQYQSILPLYCITVKTSNLCLACFLCFNILTTSPTMPYPITWPSKRFTWRMCQQIPDQHLRRQVQTGDFSGSEITVLYTRKQVCWAWNFN